MPKPIFDREKDEVEKLIGVWDNKDKLPFLHTLEQMLDFSERVGETVEIIRKSENPRLMVLETWLLIDYTVRHVLTHGLGLNKFDSEKIKILPDSFLKCLDLLKALKEDQESKPKNPSLSAMPVPGGFFSIISGDKEFVDKLIRYEQQYYRENHPEVLGTYLYEPDNISYRNVPDGWLAIVARMDKQWFSFAIQINNARNKAAHYLNSESLYKSMGISGSQKSAHLKDKCLQFLNKLISVKKYSA